MFGHVRGAFTDARADRKGRFEMADGGTIFLDEIGEIDLDAQVKLLRVLQDRSYEVLGSSITRTVDVRVVSATNRDLARAGGEGAVPGGSALSPQPDRPAPAVPARAEERHPAARPALPGLVRDAPIAGARCRSPTAPWTGCGSQTWPGNIRQLKQTLERAVLVLDDDRLDTPNLRGPLAELETREVRGTALPSPGP